MTKKPKSGTLSTRTNADKKKEANPLAKMKQLLGKNRVRFLSHANQRMGERNIVYYEVLQSLHNSKHEPSKDRFSIEFGTWQYSFKGKTIDKRELRIGISFEKIEDSEDKLLVITVIDPTKV